MSMCVGTAPRVGQKFRLTNWPPSNVKHFTSSMDMYCEQLSTTGLFIIAGQIWMPHVFRVHYILVRMRVEAPHRSEPLLTSVARELNAFMCTFVEQAVGLLQSMDFKFVLNFKPNSQTPCCHALNRKTMLL